jgi:hypothetical protein
MKVLLIGDCHAPLGLLRVVSVQPLAGPHQLTHPVIEAFYPRLAGLRRMKGATAGKGLGLVISFRAEARPD